MILAFSGPAGSGKTLASQLAEREAGIRVERFSFAALLKTVACDLWEATGVPNSAFYGTQQEKQARQPKMSGRSGREFLQDLGDLCRTYNPDVFLNVLKDDPGRLTIVDDLRYWNEAARIHELGGTIVALRRPEVMDAFRKGDQGHVSESDFLRWWPFFADHFITNEGVDEQPLADAVHSILYDMGAL